MRLTKKQKITLGVVAAVFLALLIFLGSCNRKLVSKEPAQPDVLPEPSAAETTAEDTQPQLPEPVQTQRSVSAPMGDIAVTETITYEENLTYSRREYRSFDKSRIQACRVEGTSRQAALFTFQYQPIDATVHYYDNDTRSWVSEPLSPGAYRKNLVAIEFSSGASLFAYLPKTYNQKENGVLEHLPDQDGYLLVTRTDAGWQLKLVSCELQAGQVCDGFVMSAAWPLLDWSENQNCATVWDAYTTNGVAKWCYDGYYRFTPSNYVPTGENYYYRCVASYLIRLMAEQIGLSNAAPSLTVCMLDVLAQEQNAYGFWPTQPESEWLSGDFQIADGFYDTRFNTDLIEIFIRANNSLGGGLYLDTVRRYAAFYKALAEENHAETENGGWLVADYWHPELHDLTHTSLNHLAAECLALYHLADLLEDESLREAADKLLLAIEDTGSNWVKPDWDLYYSIQPDGTYGGTDYPSLTYNDLFNLQAYLTEKNGEQNQTIYNLMYHKLYWMWNHNVTDYKR